MSRRRKLTEMSKAVIEYFCSRVSMTQTEIAGLLEVDKSFISRVRNGERELSSFHLERLAEALGVDVGVMMIDASRPTKPLSPEYQKIMDLCEKLILKCDKISKAAKAEIQSKRAS